MQNKLNIITNQLNEIMKITRLLEHSIYDDSSEHIHFKKSVEEIQSNLSVLFKHPFLNRKRIKE